MKILKKVMTLALMGVLILENSSNVYAAEKIVESRDYVPTEGTGNILGIMGMELQNGDKIVVGDYTKTSYYKVSNNGTE